MIERPQPVFRHSEALLLTGTMSIYGSQAEASRLIPQQWREFLQDHLELGSKARFFGASPCTGDHKIHYFTGVEKEDGDSSNSLIVGDRLTLEAGEYAVVQVDDPALLRDTWIWLLGSWLPGSGQRERSAPEFERFSDISDEGSPVGPVEVWIPLETV